jgi:hypothetical protein
VLRTLVVLALVALAALWVEVRWSAPERTLQLRLRESQELGALVEARGRELAERAALAVLRAWREGGREPAESPAAVGARPDAAEPQRGRGAGTPAPDQLTREDVERLDALVREATRE